MKTESKCPNPREHEVVFLLNRINFNEVIRRVEGTWNDYSNGNLNKADAKRELYANTINQFKKIQRILKEGRT